MGSTLCMGRTVRDSGAVGAARLRAGATVGVWPGAAVGVRPGAVGRAWARVWGLLTASASSGGTAMGSGAGGLAFGT
jgi:hypothetical protein